MPSNSSAPSVHIKPHKGHKSSQKTDELFKDKAPFVMTLLMREFDLTAIQAAAILGNLGHESVEFHAFHEIGQPANKGGYGWAQWTGSRRKSFFDWLKKHPWIHDWNSDIASYGYLRQELKTTYSTAITLLKKQTHLHLAVKLFEAVFESAKKGKENFENRNRLAELALNTYNQESLPAILMFYVKSVLSDKK